jgi:hypothetical protein
VEVSAVKADIRLLLLLLLNLMLQLVLKWMTHL